MNCQLDVYKGQCCCSCKYQTPVSKHPWNKTFAKGSIAETLGYACTAFVSEGNPIVFFDTKHGICEMWEEKK